MRAFGERKNQNKAGALLAAFDPHAAPMQLHDRTHDGQAETAGIARQGARGIAAVEALEQVRQVLGDCKLLATTSTPPR